LLRAGLPSARIIAAVVLSTQVLPLRLPLMGTLGPSCKGGGLKMKTRMQMVILGLANPHVRRLLVMVALLALALLSQASVVEASTCPGGGGSGGTSGCG
jgi:hypothetical protein